jgi:hypothetical protein
VLLEVEHLENVAVLLVDGVAGPVGGPDDMSPMRVQVDQSRNQIGRLPAPGGSVAKTPLNSTWPGGE